MQAPAPRTPILAYIGGGPPPFHSSICTRVSTHFSQSDSYEPGIAYNPAHLTLHDGNIGLLPLHLLYIFFGQIDLLDCLRRRFRPCYDCSISKTKERFDIESTETRFLGPIEPRLPEMSFPTVLRLQS
jgi:hypothetical protein